MGYTISRYILFYVLNQPALSKNDEILLQRRTQYSLILPSTSTPKIAMPEILWKLLTVVIGDRVGDELGIGGLSIGFGGRAFN